MFYSSSTMRLIIVSLRYIKVWVMSDKFKNEEGWSNSVGMQSIDTKLSKEMNLVTEARFV